MQVATAYRLQALFADINIDRSGSVITGCKTAAHTQAVGTVNPVVLHFDMMIFEKLENLIWR